MKLSADILIVGSGTGGATVAKELASTGKKIIVVERGAAVPWKKTGTEMHAYNYYDKHGLRSKTKEGVFYYRAFMLGGTSVVSCGNGVRALEKELKEIGIDLADEFAQTEQELGINPVPERFIGRGTRAIREAASACGVQMQPMPKFIDFTKCTSCGNCILGCGVEAKWSALKYLHQAQACQNVSVLPDITVTHILSASGRVTGAEAHNHKGEKIEITAGTVVLAAGGLGTPVILQNSGIESGQQLFLDLFVVILGLAKDSGMLGEPVMATVSHHDGFILSPFIDTPFVLASVIPVPLRRNISIMQHRQHMLGIMCKIKDDCVGSVQRDGTVEKTVTAGDLDKLNRGIELSREILLAAGVEPASILTTAIRGAHPSCTAAIGEVVDTNLETEIKGLFVGDSSVLPVPCGLPPMVTIIALAKRLSALLKRG